VNAAGIPERPLLKPWYRLASDGKRTVLEHAHVAVVFEGRAAERLLPALLPLLDGAHSVADVVSTLGEPVAPAVHNALELLGRHGLLTDGVEELPVTRAAEETAHFASAVSPRRVSPARAAETLAAASVSLAGSGPVTEHVARLLLLSGVADVQRASLAGPAQAERFAVVVPDAPEVPRLPEWNEAALEARAPWLPVLPFDGRFVAVGPLFVPGETACYECYRIRRASNLAYPEEFWALEREPRQAPNAPALAAVVAGLAALVAVRWLVERDAALPGVLTAFEPGGPPTVSTHHVYRVPRCPACSEAERVAPAAPWFDGELLA
jgi:bacteriocin biosynthesis cyclodehydratase domain-containing protein